MTKKVIGLKCLLELESVLFDPKVELEKRESRISPLNEQQSLSRIYQELNQQNILG